MGEQHNPNQIKGWGSDAKGLFVDFVSGLRRWEMSEEAAKRVALGIDHQYYGKPTEQELLAYKQNEEYRNDRAEQFEKEIQERRRKPPVFLGRSWFGQQMMKAAKEL